MWENISLHIITINKDRFRKNYPTKTSRIIKQAILFAGELYKFGKGISFKNSLQFVLDSIKKEIIIIYVFNRLEEFQDENPNSFSPYFLKDNYHFSFLRNRFAPKCIGCKLIKFS